MGSLRLVESYLELERVLCKGSCRRVHIKCYAFLKQGSEALFASRIGLE